MLSIFPWVKARGPVVTIRSYMIWCPLTLIPCVLPPIPLIIRFQCCWPPSCSSDKPDALPFWGFYIGYTLFLEYSFPDTCMSTTFIFYFTFLKFLLKCHLIWNCIHTLHVWLRDSWFSSYIILRNFFNFSKFQYISLWD